MTFDLGFLFALAVGYLGLLFLVAYSAERGWIPARIVRHPATYVLSLGVYATSWTYYGSVGFALNEGYHFLAIYLGVTLAFLLTPVLLAPILRITREYQLNSLADLFVFRYRSQVAGALVTMFLLAGIVPYIALQIRAVTESLRVLTQEATPAVLAFVFCVTVTLFAILFGARHITPREKHEGLVAAIAFESLVKLTALLMVGAYAVIGVFGGMDGLNGWLAENPQALQSLYAPLREGNWNALLLLSFAAAFLLPRQFHMAFTENMNPRALPIASWGFPLFLLLINLPILPVLWAGLALGTPTHPDYFVLGITLNAPSGMLATIAFVGGLSAASAMMIVTTLALASMALSHILLPIRYPDPTLNLYRWLLWGRRVLIALIILTGYGFYLAMEHNEGLVQLGLISFVAVAQFLPGIFGVLFWRRATRMGFLAGLLGGGFVWGATLLLPLLEKSGILILHPALDLARILEVFGPDKWAHATAWSLGVNAALFIGVSLLSRQDPDEIEAALACRRDTSALVPDGLVAAHSPDQFREQLAQTIGYGAASQEVRQALEDLDMDPHEHRQSELRRLRERIKRNLSGLVGPLMSSMIVDKRLRLDVQARMALADSMKFIEERLERSRTEFQGLAAELDALRRYHRQILQDLPLAACSIGPDREVVTWNHAMAALSGLADIDVVGESVPRLPEPWAGLLGHFIETREQHLYKIQVTLEGEVRWLNLHKATLAETPLAPDVLQRTGTVILVEDLTGLHVLEAELAHSDRLASVGRLAAGVAHEIGNPLTGITSLAQNLKHESDPGLVRESIEQILQLSRRISSIVQTLVTFSHGGAPARRVEEPFALADSVAEAVRLVRLSHEGRRVQCESLCPPDLRILGDHQRFVQVFVNLLSNACDASRPGDMVRVEAFTSGDYVQVEVVDQGEGIPPQYHERVFEPFFTTKAPGQGTGLGLPLVYSIVQEHGGQVTLDSTPGVGTRVVMRLPALAPAIAGAEADTD